MADTKISNLTAITELDNLDLIPVVDSSASETKKITWANIKTGMSISASQVSDFDDEVANNSAVALNTAKISFDSTSSTKLAGIEAGAEVNPTASEIKTAYESNADTNAFTDAQVSKLAGIEANADVTDTANVTAAGALMDSEVTNLAQVKAFNSADYATDAQGSLADSATQPGDAITTLDATAHRVFYSNGTGDVTELALGADGTFLKSNGATTAPSFAAPAGGGDALTTNPLSQFAATTSSQLAGVISDETGSGALVFATSPTLVTPALGTPASGVLTNCTGTASGLTAGNVTTNANLTGHITSTGNATLLGSFTTAQLNTAVSDNSVATLAGGETLTNKTIAAGSNTATIFTEAHAASHTLSAAECYGAVYYVTSAATLTLPAVADGMHLTVITIGAIAVSVKAGASDLIYLDGVALDDGDKVTNGSTAGDIAVLTYYDATGWHASTNGWTDGGA